MKAFKYLLIVVFLYQFGNVYAQDTLRIKVMTYNIRFGELASLEELASHIKSFNLDFVALQEIDCKTDRGERAPHQIGRDYLSLGVPSGNSKIVIGCQKPIFQHIILNFL